jgi:hypothetical protein
MPSRARLDWNGERVRARILEAARGAIDETLQAVDEDASNTHWWSNRTGYLERKILTRRAVIVGNRVFGKVGTTYSGVKGVRSAFYGLFLEYRNPWLRPAGDRQFPTLAARIRRRLAR